MEPRYNEVPRDRTIHFSRYKRNPDITKLLKKYKNFVIPWLITCFQNVLNCTIQSVIFPTVTMLLHVIETKDKYNYGNFRCSMSKYLYLSCELRYIGVQCGLGTQTLVRYTGVLVITGFIISGFLPIKLL